MTVSGSKAHRSPSRDSQVKWNMNLGRKGITVINEHVSPDAYGLLILAPEIALGSGWLGGDRESQFSPTSTLHDYDSSGSYTNSPCVGNFDVQVQELGFQQESFWSRQQVTMADARWSSFGVNPVTDMANGVPIPQFAIDSLMSRNHLLNILEST